MAPKITRNLPYKLFGIFGLIVFCITSILLCVAHGMWSSQAWEMRDGQSLKWELTLSHIYADVACNKNSDFYSTCQNVFEKTDGPITRVTEMICSLSKTDVIIETAGKTDRLILNQTCEQMKQLDDYSIGSFALLCCSALILTLAFLSLLKWCYVSFNRTRFRWYIIGITLIVVDFICLCVALILYGFGIQDLGHTIFFPDISTPVMNDSLINPVGSTSHGFGFYYCVVIACLHLLLIVLYTVWVPRGMKPIIKKSRPSKTSKGSKAKSDEQPLLPDGEPSKKVFWAFMPDVLQPAIGGDDVFAQYNLYDDEYTVTTTEQQQFVTGYGTVETRIAPTGFPTVSYTHDPMVSAYHYGAVTGNEQQPQYPHGY